MHCTSGPKDQQNLKDFTAVLDLATIIVGTIIIIIDLTIVLLGQVTIMDSILDMVLESLSVLEEGILVA